MYLYIFCSLLSIVAHINHTISDNEGGMMWMMIGGGAGLLVMIPFCFACGYFYNKKKNKKETDSKQLRG